MGNNVWGHIVREKNVQGITYGDEMYKDETYGKVMYGDVIIPVP
jgi:hypothetical protein